MLTSVFFSISGSKRITPGPVPACLRIPVKGWRAGLAIGRKCEPGCRSITAGRTAGTKASFKSLNSYPGSLQVKSCEAHRQLVEATGHATAIGIKNRVSGKTERGTMLFEIFKDHNTRVVALSGDGFPPATLHGTGVLGQYIIESLLLFCEAQPAAAQACFLHRFGYSILTGSCNGTFPAMIAARYGKQAK